MDTKPKPLVEYNTRPQQNNPGDTKVAHRLEACWWLDIKRTRPQYWQSLRKGSSLEAPGSLARTEKTWRAVDGLELASVKQIGLTECC
ncbi:hypothetical protein VFPFJ_01057 [Purpureocillium lilacinum]|uniref:Uncharacterized protein n=1 Tax=Purpureocillium lilacinum TaxID=33203 RepID=A0A179HZP0_PURLI|nr:hypothetical protein VFPFJ_01057 [Purpureocillium lilacinum]OAQ94948.1 hypothetical protein VFPFJ_01057 [Purpureocillium lilacinum]